MIDKELQKTIDGLWDTFWSSGISNPITVIEQMTYLIFLKLLDERESDNEFVASKTNKKFEFVYSGKDEDGVDYQKYRWNEFKQLEPEEMLTLVRDKAFPFIKNLKGQYEHMGKLFKDAVWHINKPSLLDTAVQTLDGIDFKPNGDAKGDLYEYMLSKLSTAGTNGQFRTPRHIIRMMVEIIDPKATERICDPACGTAGFLFTSLEYILEQNTSDEFKATSPRGADLLSDRDCKFLYSKSINGFDFDSTMLRISSMNLILNNVNNPNINHLDTLSKDYNEADAYDVVLANPPFTGSLADADVNPKLKAIVKTKKTELLFLALFLRMMKVGGRGAVIVPSGVLSTESTAHKKLREKLIENNQLEAVITMPSGVFKPYAGVATAILVFTKGGQTEKTWFYTMENDGFSLDDKRTKIGKNDIPDVVKKWNTREESDKSFNVSYKDLKENDYNLLPSRYKKIEYKPVEFEYTPQEYVQQLIKLENDILASLHDLAQKLEGCNIKPEQVIETEKTEELQKV